MGEEPDFPEPGSYDEYQQERQQQALDDRRYLDLLNQHPDCEDPLHPGCFKCEEKGIF